MSQELRRAADRMISAYDRYMKVLIKTYPPGAYVTWKWQGDKTLQTGKVYSNLGSQQRLIVCNARTGNQHNIHAEDIIRAARYQNEFVKPVRCKENVS